MKGDKVALTLYETTCIGFLSGFAGGVLLYFAITLNAAAAAREMDAMGSASHMCAAGSAAMWLAILSVPAGAIFGFCLGGFFLWRKAAAGRRPLP
ncbi:MAG TPA: hypothetical protein VGB76_21035 [Pyrinomonadaceae bacterium]|jgi:hypothetical protein